MLLVFSGALVLGGTLSATVIWLTSGLGGGLQPAWRIGLLAALTIVAVLREFHVLNIALPQNARQIPQEVFAKGLLLGPFQFGFELGTGVRTFVSASLPYILAAALWLYATDYRIALLVGATFGLGRAAMTAARYWSGAVERWDERLERRMTWLPPAALVVGVATAAMIVAGGVLHWRT
jgi:hypothetical protein